MKHLIAAQTHKGVTVKCGAEVHDRADATIWWSEVDCPDCRPYEWAPDPDGPGKMMVLRKREETSPPGSRVMRRRTKR